MKELHSFGWYAARISPHLPKKAFEPVPTRLLGGLTYVLISLSGILAIGFLSLNVWANLVIAFVLGLSFAGTAFLGHEILHGTVVKNPFLRNLFGGIALWPLTTGPRLWRKWHNIEHHSNAQDEHNDPDAWATMEKLYNRPFMHWIYKLPQWFRSTVGFSFYTLTFTAHSFRMFTRFIGKFKKENRPMVWLQFILPWLTFGALFWWLGVHVIFAYLVPVIIANIILTGYISTNHRLNPLVPVNDPLANSLTVTVPKWVDVLHFNFSYHTEHHLFPGMNPKYYPLVKKHLKEMWPEKYHELPIGTALKALWKTPRVYYKFNDLIDPAQGHLYGSLGNKLDSVSFHHRPLVIEEGNDENTSDQPSNFTRNKIAK